MDCRSCGVVNAPGRRYCRECGARLGQPCSVCHFFNSLDDKHCGGCGRRLRVPGTLAAGAEPLAAYAPALTDDIGIGDDSPAPAAPAGDTGISGQGVSQSEIDGLFENILDDENGNGDESREGGG